MHHEKSEDDDDIRRISKEMMLKSKLATVFCRLDLRSPAELTSPLRFLVLETHQKNIRRRQL